MSEEPASYIFHTHCALPAWRLVVRADRAPPAGMKVADWRITRARRPDDVNPDVRREVDERGYSLFKVGGSFEDVDREVEGLAAQGED